MEINNKKVEKQDTDWLLDKKKSRDIVQEILRFGVTQAQIKNIINFKIIRVRSRQFSGADQQHKNKESVIFYCQNKKATNSKIELEFQGPSARKKMRFISIPIFVKNC